MGVVRTESIACGRVTCLRVTFAYAHMRSEEKSRDIFLKGRQRERGPLLLRVSGSFASSEAMYFVRYGLLVSLVVTHTVMFTHVSLYLHTFIMVYTRKMDRT